MRKISWLTTLLLAGAIVPTTQAAEICNSVAECAQLAVEAAKQAESLLAVATPPGAVIAFNQPSCPEGWSLFRPGLGRVVVGAGEGSGLSPRVLGEVGGEEMHTLTVEEMPSHNHNSGEFDRLLKYWDGNWSGTKFDGSPGEVDSAHHEKIQPAGGSKPHNTMPPFVVLTYCERD